jgi:MiaB/RimO family radical SAM methylthiotransferase
MTTDSIKQEKVYISTTGCVEAQLSSEVVARVLKQNNYVITREVCEANFVIFYACGLTEYSQERSLRGIVNLKKKMNQDAKLTIWGCLTKQNPEAIKSVQQGQVITPLDLVLRQNLEASDIPLNGLSIAASTEELMNLREISHEFTEDPLDRFTRSVLLARMGKQKLRDKVSGRTKAYYIRIAKGCNGNCTYCSEKPVFGEISSRPIEEVVNDFKKGLSLGYNRFSLLATDLGAYGIDINTNLGTLLNRIIDTKTDIDYKLILNQIEPHNFKTIYPTLDESLASERVEELMSPVQSGSNRVLKLMGRKYAIEDWRSIMLKINTNYPKIRLNTHFLVGFPTESDEDFNETMKLLDPPPFLDDITVFKYSSRPSVASRLIPGQISEAVKETRRKKILKKFAKIYMKNFIT